MKISKLVSLTVLAVACGAQAAPVGTAEIKVAAKAWAARGAALGARVGAGGVDSATAYAVTNGYSFYAVKLTGGGTVFLSSDTELEPVIAFSPDSNIDLSKEGNPLLQLLRRDIIARVGLRDLRKASLASGALAQSQVFETGKNEQKWAAFGIKTQLSPVSSQTGAALTKAVISDAATASAAPVKVVDDLCVAPLLTTKWNQTTDANGDPCFNYYMWSELGGAGGRTDDWPCGCTATAMSQVMRYHRYPTAEQAARTYTCKVDDASVGLATKAGVFAWGEMVDWPDGNYDMSEAQREAIGHLTWNAAVALKSSFAADSTGADPSVLAEALRNGFGYASAWSYWDDGKWNTGQGGLHDRATREKIVHTNLDAGRPVLFGIYGYTSGHIGDMNYWGGHAVVGDGYGYQSVDGEKTAYVHINMGWGGTDDVWYNIPEIDAANSGAHIGSGGTTFLYMGSATFNIAATTEDGVGEILSGRIYDEDRQPLAGAVVSVYENDALVKTTVSGERGVYGFILPGGHTYTVSARSADGRLVADPLTGIKLAATTGDSTYVVDSEEKVGNSWGNDFVLEHPSVRIGSKVYGSLNAALAAVKREGLANPVLEVVDVTSLRESVTVDFVCTVVSTNADPTATLISRLRDSQLTVARGGKIAFRNVAFASEVSGVVLVRVEEGGSISVEGRVGLGRVVTADAGGFVLAGAIAPVENGIVIGEAGEETVRGTAFGRYTCSLEEAQSNAAKIVKFNDNEFGGAATESGDLIWDRVPVDPSAALAMATNDDFGTTYYRSLNQLFADYWNGAEIVILKDCATNTFTKPLTINKAVTIRSEGAARAIAPASTACISIADGGSLTVSNLTFSGFVGTRLFSVRGGSLTLAAGATLKDLTGTGYMDEDGDGDEGGVVRLDKGALTMLPGSRIENCRVAAEGGGIGGGIAALGGTLNLLGGTITGCSAVEAGGGVYSYGATVKIEDAMRVTGNVNGDGKADNIYLAKANASLQIVGPMAGAKIGLQSAKSANNAEGKAFAAIETSLTAEQRAEAAAAFSCDANEMFFAETNGASLVWKTRIDDGTCAEADAVVRIVYPKGAAYPGGTNLHYAAVSEAFRRLTGDATVEILKDAVFDADLTIAHQVTLCSAPETERHVLGRAEVAGSGISRIVVAAGGSLTVTNLTLSGNDVVETRGFAMIEVAGSLTLQNGATVSNVRSVGVENAAAHGAILVDAGGTLTMESGAVISDCTSIADDEESGRGAGIYLLLGGTANLKGGLIENCRATSFAGVFAANGSKVYVSGDFTAQNNLLQYQYPLTRSNLSISKNSELYLTDALTGDGLIGYTADVSCSETVFGKVQNRQSWEETALTNSAAHFRNDVSGDYGVVVTNAADTALLVWKSALADDGSYTDDSTEDGAVYWVMAIPEVKDEPMPVPVTCEPFKVVAVTSITEGKWQLTLNPGTEACTYRLYGSDDLSAIVSEANLKATVTLEASDIDENGDFRIEVETLADRQFWQVVGEDGVKYIP